MKEDRKKELELKWSQLIAEMEKPDQTNALTKTKELISATKVIRRRKGNPDLRIP